MSTISNSFTALGAGGRIALPPGASALYNASGASITATMVLEYSENGGNSYITVTSGSASAATLGFSGIVTNDGLVNRLYRLRCSSYASGTITGTMQDVGNALSGIPLQVSQGAMVGVGAVNQPSSGVLGCLIKHYGDTVVLTFTLNAVRISVTDAGGSGSSGSHKLFDFEQAGIVPIACRQDYTAFAEGSALTGGAGDAAFKMGLGSVAADAGDGALTGTEVDFGAITGTITLSGGTATGTKFSGAGLNTNAALDGTGTAVDLYLNWSGTAATIDANSTIDVTGTITVICMLMGDD